MGSEQELKQVLAQLQAQVQQLKEENASLRSQLQKNPSANDTRTSKTAPTAEADASKKRSSKEPKPPPIFISGIKNIGAFDNLLKNSGLEDSERKALSNNELKVLPKTADSYRKLRTLLNNPLEANDPSSADLGVLKYHTYQLKSEKSYVVFIRNLHHSTAIEDICDELKQVGHSVRNITNVQIKRNVAGKSVLAKLPLFRVELEPSNNNSDVLDMTHMLFCRIKVELPKRSNEVPQCKRCQNFGHSQNYCTKTPRCVKCGEKHLTKDCKKLKSAKPKCANCGEEHTANYKGCVHYQRVINPVQVPKTSAVDRIRDKPDDNKTPARNNRKYSTAVRSFNYAITAPANRRSATSSATASQPVVAPSIGNPANTTTPSLDRIDAILSAIQGIANTQRIIQLDLEGALKRISSLEQATDSPPSPARKIRK